MIRRQGTFVFLVAVTLVMAGALDADAQGRRGGQRGSRSMGGMSFGGPMRGGAIALLRRKDVQKELELVDDQIKELEAIGEGGWREALSGLRDLPREEQFTKMREVMEEQRKQVEAKINDILLPHQLKRYKQLQVQSQMRGNGAAIMMGRVAEQLNITESQRDELRKKFADIQGEIRAEIEAIQAKARDRLLKELTPAQQAKFKSMVGETFKFTDEPPRGPGRSSGGRSRRGN